MAKKREKSPRDSTEAVVRRHRGGAGTTTPRSGDASAVVSKSGRPAAIGRASGWKDPDDAPEVTDEMLDGATFRQGDRVIRPRGRPPLGGQPKTQVTLRLDADVVTTYRSTGEGWQSRINADLRRSADKWRKA